MSSSVPRLAAALLLASTSLLFGDGVHAHDIPNARVDRSTQVIVLPGRLQIDYEVSLAELTLTQELRSLIGTLPGAERSEWFAAYGRETGPLNAKGFLVSVDDAPITLAMTGFELQVEEHPRFLFHLSADLPPQGRLSINDTNFASSEGTSRLAIRGVGMSLVGDDLPGDVTQIPVRPVWQLTDSEERRTRMVEVRYASPAVPVASAAPSPSQVSPATPERTATGLSRLLDRSTGISLTALCLLAIGLGAAHALQPGHGKTLVSAVALGDRGGSGRAALLAFVTTVTHTGSVLLIAAGLWSTESLRFAEVHLVVARTAGFVIGAVGCWRLGRHLAGFTEHEIDAHDAPTMPRRGVVGLGVAGGLVPCWDAVALIVMAEALGRLGLGILLVVAFSLGMGIVLVLVGWLAGRLRHVLVGGAVNRKWEHRLGLASGLALSAMGVYLLSV